MTNVRKLAHSIFCHWHSNHFDSNSNLNAFEWLYFWGVPAVACYARLGSSFSLWSYSVRLTAWFACFEIWTILPHSTGFVWILPNNGHAIGRSQIFVGSSITCLLWWWRCWQSSGSGVKLYGADNCTTLWYGQRLTAYTSCGNAERYTVTLFPFLLCATFDA